MLLYYLFGEYFNEFLHENNLKDAESQSKNYKYRNAIDICMLATTRWTVKSIQYIDIMDWIFYYSSFYLHPYIMGEMYVPSLQKM